LAESADRKENYYKIDKCEKRPQEEEKGKVIVKKPKKLAFRYSQDFQNKMSDQKGKEYDRSSIYRCLAINTD